jgi:import inner membrane translocase subunit TIM21
MYLRRRIFLTGVALRKMSPNRVFDRSFEIIRKDPEIIRQYGESVKAYGRDHGGHREGRRNFVEHTEYVSPDDGSKRTRVRYNLEGRFGNAFCFAEVSNQMPSGEFVYILVQDKSNGRVQTIVDNRAAMTAARLTAGSKEAQSAMSQLLTGSSNK